MRSKYLSVLHPADYGSSQYLSEPRTIKLQAGLILLSPINTASLSTFSGALQPGTPMGARPALRPQPTCCWWCGTHTRTLCSCRDPLISQHFLVSFSCSHSPAPSPHHPWEEGLAVGALLAPLQTSPLCPASCDTTATLSWNAQLHAFWTA